MDILLSNFDQDISTIKGLDEYRKAVNKHLTEIKNKIEEAKGMAINYAMSNGIKDNHEFEIAGQKFKFDSKATPSVLTEKAFDWINDNEPGLVKPTIHHQTLRKFLKGMDPLSLKKAVEEGWIGFTAGVKIL